jgi:hypothetical protein
MAYVSASPSASVAASVPVFTASSEALTVIAVATGAVLVGVVPPPPVEEPPPPPQPASVINTAAATRGAGLRTAGFIRGPVEASRRDRQFIW